MAGLYPSPLMRLAVALCLSVAAMWAQVEPTDADRAFAAILRDLPNDQAHARVAAADSSQLTEGLCRALFQSVLALSAKHHDLPRVLAVTSLATEIAHNGGFTREEAVGHYNTGTGLVTLGRFDEAIEHFNLALSLFQQIAAKPETVGDVYANRGIAQRRLGNYRAALDDLHRAEKIFRETGKELNVARSLNNAGLVFQGEGDYRRAMQALEQSLEIAVRHNEPLGQSFVLNNMAETAIFEGDYDLAAAYATRSLKIKEAVASQEDLATTLSNIGTIYHHAGKDREAEDAFKRALRIANEAGLKPVEAEALGALGHMEFDQKRYAAALVDLESSTRLHHESGERLTEARTLGWTARVRLAMGDTAAALQLANRARDLAREIGTTPELLVPSFVAGHIYRTSGHYAEARVALEEAISATEQIRDSVAGAESEREAFLAEHAAPYREMAALEAGEGHWTAALAVSERSKSRVLLDLMGGRERPVLSMTAGEATRETQLRGRLAELGAQFRLASSETSSAAKLPELRSAMDRAHAELVDFRIALDAAHPGLSVRRGEVQPIGWPVAADLAAGAQTAILDYAATPGGMYLFVIRRGHPMAVHRLPAPDLHRQIQDFREKLATRDPEFPAAASRLYEALVGPARAEVAGKTMLIVAPDGDLWQAPFQALRSPTGRYLIEDAAIFYAPSLSVLAALRKSRRPTGGAHVTLAAFGNPTGDWAESESEVGKLAALYGPAASSVWVGPQASEDNFRRNAGTYDVVHVAAHGVFDEEHPLRSRLVFHPPQEKRSEDGWLQAEEIRDLDMRAALVVLSGCETGRGNFEEGEGAVGLAWAFLAAGNRAVLASQWRVESTSTTELMARFHAAWRRGSGKAQALRQAALELLQSPRFRHPFYWAGFQLFGDGY